ncbi:MAG: biopolymer transporter ExbD [Pirellulaceae bacterium]|jgi:biopolymer transport protein ExbD|nr:biopolymer transporter ExbD [Pirellulaceae bacterium]
MKFRHVGSQEERKIELQMTPMIDIVFQLLTFFIMSFKIVAQEGDFNIQMPLATQQQGLPEDSPLVTLHVQLRADATGRLLSSGGIVVNGERMLDSIEALHNFVIGVVGGDEPSARADAEVEFDFDYGLHYEHIIEAITAVSGYVDRSTGQVQKLIEKIKFTPPAEPAAS